jgi:hypothetical protein
LSINFKIKKIFQVCTKKSNAFAEEITIKPDRQMHRATPRQYKFQKNSIKNNFSLLFGFEGI